MLTGAVGLVMGRNSVSGTWAGGANISEGDGRPHRLTGWGDGMNLVLLRALLRGYELSECTWSTRDEGGLGRVRSRGSTLSFFHDQVQHQLTL